MSISTVNISNIAIGRLGGVPIMSLDDQTTEADLCKANYEQSRNISLEGVDWTFARERAQLAPLVGVSGEIVGTDYSHRFKLPPNCLVLRGVSTDGSFRDRVTWEKEGDTILSNSATMFIKFTKEVVDPNLFSSNFILLYSTQLAADICVSLTANAKLKVQLDSEVESLVDKAGGADGVQSLPERQQAHRIINARFRI